MPAGRRRTLARGPQETGGYGFEEGLREIGAAVGLHERRRCAGICDPLQITRCIPGAWEVRELQTNGPAQAFWRRAIGTRAGSRHDEATWQKNGFGGIVQRFLSPGREEGPRSPASSRERLSRITFWHRYEASQVASTAVSRPWQATHDPCATDRYYHTS